MFSSKKITTFTDKSSDKLERVKRYLQEADAVIIGAGAGLSTSAGFTYTGERFEKYFSDFIEKYGFQDMYSGGFYPFESLEEYWAYWSRYIYINRYCDTDNGTYRKLFELVKNKDYFVLTTNVDHQFQKAGFDRNRLFYTQGDYGLFQCSKPCHNTTYDNENMISQMLSEQKDMRIPTELIPHCPKCGKPLTMNLRADNTFVEDGGWHKASKRYSDFIISHQKGRVLYLELGVGFNTPNIIKYPFWKMTKSNLNAIFVCLNYGEAYVSQEIAEKSICINDDIRDILFSL